MPDRGIRRVDGEHWSIMVPLKEGVELGAVRSLRAERGRQAGARQSREAGLSTPLLRLKGVGTGPLLTADTSES